MENHTFILAIDAAVGETLNYAAFALLLPLLHTSCLVMGLF